jgi:3-methyladenine DNA glycosylase AlkD
MPDPSAGLVRLVRRRIADAGDPARAPRMQAYMKSAMPYRGVAATPLSRLLRATYDEHPLPDRRTWEAVVRELWDGASYREERYAALALATHRSYRGYQDPDLLPLHEHLVVSGAWWDVVDAVASRHVGGVLAAYPAETTPVLRRWSVADDLWLRRSAIIAQLHRKDDTDLGLLRDAIEANLEGSPYGSDFFVRKAIGWALRQHARTDPGWVRALVAEHETRLSGLSRREALKHL